MGGSESGRKMGIEWLSTGDGFTWLSKDMDETTARALHGWKMAQEKIASGDYDLIVLDEFTYPLHFGWLDVNEVVAWLKEHKPPMLHLIITGREAPQELVEFADLVTEMKESNIHTKSRTSRRRRGLSFNLEGTMLQNIIDKIQGLDEAAMAAAKARQKC
jgi:cob(I)alamin adenosyltransferase